MTREKIYLIPGTMCTEQLWSVLLPCLTSSLHGKYEFIHVKIPRDKSFSQISEFLNDIISEERASILGFSLGGYIASHFATTYPQRVNKIFVIANSPCSLNPAEVQQRQEIIDYVNQHGYKGISKARAIQLLDNSLSGMKDVSEHQLDHLIDIIVSMDAELGDIELKSQLQHTSHRDDLFDQLANMQSKAVFYYSEHDFLVNSAWLTKLQQANANCQVICTQGASHMLPLSKPKELASHLSAWLNSK